MMVKITEKKRKGFTLLEALTASVILGMAVVTLSGISTRCISQIQLNQQYEQAWQILDRQLTMIGAMGIEEFIMQGTMEGEINSVAKESDEANEPMYYWQVQTSSEPIDNLYKVDITVQWVMDKKGHTISATTLLDGQAGLVL